MKKINTNKILKEIEKINKQLEETGHFLTLKGIVDLTINLVEEQLEK